MYGKIFSTMYEGSMVGAGATAFAVMGYAISKQQPPDFNVELNSVLLSAILGEPEEKVVQAIEFLCAPDPRSRTETEEGRRLLKVGAFTYHMVNGEAYYNIRNTEERKAYNRDAQAKYREKKKKEGVNVPPPKPPKPPKQPEAIAAINPIPAHLRSARMTTRWEEWMAIRRKKAKPSSWPDLFNEHIKFLTQFTEPEAFEVLDTSARNNWQGLFEPKSRSGFGATVQPKPVNGSNPYRGLQHQGEGETREAYHKRIAMEAGE